MKSFLHFLLIPISIIAMIGVLLYYNGVLYINSSCDEAFFKGKGTEEEPYLIQSLDDLKLLRDLVNYGESFEDTFFLQCEDIDFQGENWVPIGLFGSDHYFAGIYDGGTHYISNLSVVRDGDSFPFNGGFFGVLDGTVKNFGIESGMIDGDYVGAITSHGTDRALILNCYNKASVKGTWRAGGICDNIGWGSVINCVNYGQVSAPVSAQIVSYNAKYLIAVYPKDGACLKDFRGIYIDVPMTGDSIEERLNTGLSILMEEKVLEEEDIIKW